MTMFTNQTLILGSLGSAVLGWLMFMLSVFLILLILVQRGKGGGLTGALGGPGGQSAFGSKAGDTFTLITAVSAIIWGLVCAIAMYSLGVPPLTADDADYPIDDTPALQSPADDSADATGAGGLSGLSGLLSEEPAASDQPAADSDPEADTPSMELTPAETTPAEDAPAEATPDEDAAAESTESNPE
ncbi:preprotein translocase subunit SecG [Stieleria mannarensis]|uniref:preprotein translocase subunit SecG n=1 Tax=Stieleria mannarensis TaxID=2755585 RepID=UPI0025701800|nr:preprotein translocase subunit SecG [Rhodopirellula sp. JC639]